MLGISYYDPTKPRSPRPGLRGDARSLDINSGAKLRFVKLHLKFFLKDNPALLCSCLAWNDGIPGFG